jgi:hypothetical protein
VRSLDGPTYLQHSCAQTLTKALLDLDLAADGYVLRIDKQSPYQRLLCNAAKPLYHLFGRVVNDANSFDIEPASARELTEKGDNFWDAMASFKPTRAFFRKFYAFDDCLSRLHGPDNSACTAVGAAMINNAEF